MTKMSASQERERVRIEKHRKKNWPTQASYPASKARWLPLFRKGGAQQRIEDGRRVQP